ncbi:MAG: acyl-homoserine-lactone synthase [Pseudomonadota bacterium]
MIVYVTPTDRLSLHERIYEYFKLRKKIFCDQLSWEPPKPHDLEYDEYDDYFNIYILYVDDDSNQLFGGVRFMPTKGYTEIHKEIVKQDLDPAEIVSPNIWEASRFCALGGKTKRRPNCMVNRAALALALASIEFCRANDISHIVGICDAQFLSMAEAFGVNGNIICEVSGVHDQPRYCCKWRARADSEMLTWSRRFLGNDGPPVLCTVL